MRMTRLSLVIVLIAPFVTACAFGQGSGKSTEPSGVAGSADAQAEAAFADFSEIERERILAVAPVVERAAAERALDPSLIYAVIWVESRFDVQAHSPAGARGLMQLMPATAAHLAKQMGEARPRVNDPEFNVRAGSLYLAAMIEKFGDESKAIAAYHAGPGNVAKWEAAGKQFPDWSDEYVAAVMAARERFRAVSGSSERLAEAEPIPVEAIPEGEPIHAPDPETLPDAAEIHRLAAAGMLDDESPPEQPPIAAEADVETVFEPHPEADANPEAGAPPGWPTKRTATPAEPRKRTVIAAKPPEASPDQPAPGLGVLPDL